MIISIVNCDKNLGIGKNNDLLFSLPTDMKFFRESTKGHVVALGKNTLDSFPNGKPLKNRKHIVLHFNKVDVEGVITATSLEEFFSLIKEEAEKDDVFVIGGASVYRQTIDLVDEVWVTLVDADGKATVFFPEFRNDFVLYEESEPIEENGLTFRFTKWKRK